MFLALDIGNTTITLGLYEGEKPGPRWRLETVRTRLADEYGLTRGSPRPAPAQRRSRGIHLVIMPLRGPGWNLPGAPRRGPSWSERG
jgi:type III pantothenate kinase